MPFVFSKGDAYMNNLLSMFPLSRVTRVRGLTFLLVGAITVILSVFLPNARAQDESLNTAEGHDMLAYVSNDGQLMLYNPRDRTETALLDDVRTFKLGSDGRVAFTKLDENDTGLYIFGPSNDTLTPVITENPDAYNSPLAWSPDGRYLAFGSYHEPEGLSLYVWDGETATNVMPENPLAAAVRFYVDWSHDGRLAFQVIYGWSNLDIPPEVYVWDGHTMTNLNPNPDGWDGYASWSEDGKLLFGSRRDDDFSYCVWDGVSFKDGLPDADTFIPVAPELEPGYLAWVTDGVIRFTVNRVVSLFSTVLFTRKVIMLWDVESGMVINEYPVSSDNAWSYLAEGGQVILSSHLASGIPSYYLDVENTQGQILFSIHTGEYSWSPDGYLAYCGIEEGYSRELSIWDGQESWIVARVSYKPAQWQSEQYTFSCNNG